MREQNVTNSADSQYYTTLYLGSQKTALTFTLDTGSSWFWVPSVTCTTCKKNKFNSTLSKNFTKGTLVQTSSYGVGSATGNVSSDIVGLTSTGSVNASSVKFLLVTSVTNMTDIVSDGVLGLSPTFPDSTGELFINKLYNASIVSQRMFSLSFARNTSVSKLHLGGYSESYVLNRYTADERTGKSASDLINWINLTASTYWQLRLTKANVFNGTKNNNTNYTIIPIYPDVVLDSGSTYSYLPKDDYQ